MLIQVINGVNKSMHVAYMLYIKTVNNKLNTNKEFETGEV